MPRVSIIQTNFTSGELSPKCYGRVDVARYQNAAEIMENCFVNIHGGAQRRYGSRFIAATKDSSKRSRLVPFVFSATQAYILEFGDFYMRVYLQGAGQVLSGGVPYEIATPYSEAMVSEFDFTQGADTMFIFHQGVMINTLQRFASDSWVLRAGPFDVLPFDVVGHRFAATLTLSAATVGTGRTATASSGVFLQGDVGRRITNQAGEAKITGYTSATQGTVEITQAFSGTSIAANAWVLADSPKSALKASDKGPVGATISLSLQSDAATPTLGATKTITGIAHDGVSTATITCPSHGFSNGINSLIEGCTPAGYNGTYTINVINSNTFTYTVTNPGAATILGTARTTTAVIGAVNGFRTGDVGKYIRVNDGLVKVTAFGSASSLSGVIVKELSSSEAVAPADAWTLESAVWNADNGYPRTGVLYEQRLVVAGTAAAPQGMWGSQSGFPFSFTIGTNDDDAFAFSLPTTGQINPIQHLVASSALLLMTYGDEYTMEGGVEKPLTPTNVRAKPRSARGSATVKPVRVGGETLFVQRAGRKVRALAYDTDSGQYAAPDLTVLSEHITGSGITGMAYQQEPRSIVWCVRADGQFATMTIDRDEGVLAWTRSITDGVYESVASIPSATGDEVWTIVRRTINGVTKRYVERFEETLYSDCAVTGTSGPGTSVWGGINHLEGKAVDVVADGAYKGRYTVAGGQITLDRNAYAVEIGLPYTTRIKLLRPEVQSGEGTSQGSNMRTHEVSLLFDNTVGGKINDSELTTRNFGSDLLDRPPPALSGFTRLGFTDWARGESDIEITQEEPLPFHLLAVIRKFTTNS